MKKVVPFPDRAEALEQASQWVAKMVSDTMTEADQNVLDQWLAESPSHPKILLECADAWDELDELSQLAEMFPRKQTQMEPSEPRSSSSWHSSKGFGWGGALAAAAVFAALLITDYPGENQSHKFVRHAATEVGEYKTAVLPDGSKATLNTNSQLETEFETDDSIRKVALLRGEAHFDVEPDPSRPFVVEVGNTRVVAVGTAFNIDSSSGEIEVTVTEGIVEIYMQTAVAAQETSDSSKVQHALQQQLIAGQIAIVNDHRIRSVAVVKAPELERKLLWQKGKVQFVGEPLSQVVQEISRYTHYNFEFSDPQAGDIRVGGYFQIGNIDEMLDVLSTTFDIEVKKDASGVIYLSSRESTSVSG
jgi:transmembrane sensor